MPVQMPNIQPLQADQTGAAAFQRGLSGMQNAVITGMNAPYQNQILRSQAQYAPLNNYLDVAQKQQMLKYLPTQMQAQLLSNPMLLMNMPKEQLGQLVSQYTSSFPQAGNNPAANINIPMPGQGSGGMGNNYGYYQGQSGQTGSSTPSYSGSQGGYNPATTGQNIGQPNPYVTGNGASIIPESSPLSSNPGGMIQNPSSTPLGGYAGNPYAQMEASKAQGTQQSAANIGQWNDAMAKVSQASNAANNLRNEAATFSNSYDKSFLKGPQIGKMDPGGIGGMVSQWFGHDPGNEQTMNNAANNMVANMASQGNYGKVAGPEINYLKSAKPSSTMTESAKNNVTNQIYATADRTNAQLGFYNQLRNNGATQPEADVLWNQYNQQLPPYDQKTYAPNNVYNKSAWQAYTTPDAINTIRSNKMFTPYNLKDIKAQQAAAIANPAPTTYAGPSVAGNSSTNSPLSISMTAPSASSSGAIFYNGQKFVRGPSGQFHPVMGGG